MAAGHQHRIRSDPGGRRRFAIYLWRSEREGGDTKTEKSRRTLALPRCCVEALRQQRDQQERDRQVAGDLWQEHLCFPSRDVALVWDAIDWRLHENNAGRLRRRIFK